MHGSDAIDSADVLRESEGALGVLLWKTVRSVRLWAELPARDRAGAYEGEVAQRREELIESVGVPERLAEPLGRASTVLRGRARPSTVCKGCREIAAWAVEEGKLGTAVEFLQAAAVAAPADGTVAHEVARVARMRGEYSRAETWYREAISRARRSREWYEFSRSYIGLGIVYSLRGAYPQATKSLIRGLRAARRFSIRPLIAAAAHELVVVGIRTDRAPEVARYARVAVEAYGPGHERLPALAHDVAIFLLNSGYLTAAKRILTTTRAEYTRPIDRLGHWAALVRLGGALGDEALYREALARTEALLGEPCTGECTVPALLSIARGADSIGETDRALSAAERAAEIAKERGEARLQFTVEAELESLRNRSGTAAAARRHRTPRPLESLITELEGALGAEPART